MSAYIRAKSDTHLFCLHPDPSYFPSTPVNCSHANQQHTSVTVFFTSQGPPTPKEQLARIILPPDIPTGRQWQGKVQPTPFGCCLVQVLCLLPSFACHWTASSACCQCCSTWLLLSYSLALCWGHLRSAMAFRAVASARLRTS